MTEQRQAFTNNRCAPRLVGFLLLFPFAQTVTVIAYSNDEVLAVPVNRNAQLTVCDSLHVQSVPYGIFHKGLKDEQGARDQVGDDVRSNVPFNLNRFIQAEAFKFQVLLDVFHLLA